MSFEAAPVPIILRFEPGHKYHGAEAKLQGMAIGEFMQVTGMDGGDGENNAQTIERFFKSLVSWNLTSNGEPLPPTPESMDKVDKGLVLALNNAYVKALTGVHDTDPLPDSSTSGEPSPAPAIPMAPLSESQAS